MENGQAFGNRHRQGGLADAALGIHDGYGCHQEPALSEWPPDDELGSPALSDC